MPILKLTDAKWMALEEQKVYDIMTAALGGENRAGINEQLLEEKLKYVGLDYFTTADLIALKAYLIGTGDFEEV